VAVDVLAEINLVLDDPERWRRAMASRSKVVDVHESLARTWVAADLVGGLAQLREYMRAGVIQFTPAFIASVTPGSVERVTLDTPVPADAAGAAATRVNAADAGLAVAAEWLGLTKNRAFTQSAAGRAAWTVLARNLAGAAVYDGTNPTYEFGASSASAAGGLPAKRSRYERSNELRQGDPYGDLATLHINAARGRLAATDAYIAEAKKNVFGTATTAPTGELRTFNAFVCTNKK
jgi:hypothetical protein